MYADGVRGEREDGGGGGEGKRKEDKQVVFFHIVTQSSRTQAYALTRFANAEWCVSELRLFRSEG